MQEGHLERHIRKVRNVYAAYRKALLTALDALLPTAYAWVAPGDQGMHLVLWLAANLDDRAIALAAADVGVAVRAVSPTFAPGTGRPGLILGFGGFTVAQMWTAAERLASVILSAKPARGRMFACLFN